MMEMKALIAKSPLGAFAFTEDGNLIHFEPLQPPDALAEPPQSFVEQLAGYEIEEKEDAYAFLRRNFRTLVRDLTAKSDEEINADIILFAELFSQKRLSSAISRDKLLVQASNALEDLNKTINLYNERLYEWFSLHYPEFRQQDVAKLIAKYGRRENFPSFSVSLGISLGDEDEKAVKGFADMILHVGEELRILEKYVAKSVKEIMPNVTSLIDPLLAAKLLAYAGSLERLARMPASTIQILGAEKALFRHLKKQGKSPKFGLLFSDGRIKNAPRDRQGRIARIIAAKLMLAARIDFYSKRKEPKLREQLDKELERV